MLFRKKKLTSTFLHVIKLSTKQKFLRIRKCHIYVVNVKNPSAGFFHKFDIQLKNLIFLTKNWNIRNEYNN